MYEYKCSNEACSHVWTLKEGDIGSMYLTCPVCKKGRGLFLRQLRSEGMHEDIQKIPIRKTEEDFVEAVQEIEETKEELVTPPVVQVQEEKPKTRGRKKKVQEVPAEEVVKEVKTEQKPKKKAAKVEKKQIEMEATTPAAEQTEEDDIFTRIRKKRQMEEELRRGCEDEDTDILEVSGSTLEEIEARIKEFEEYYYIKVLDKNIQKQGKRYNCIIKYCRK